MIIPIYNGAADLPDLLSCLEQQTYQSETLDYLLVDNNSQDDTARLIEDAVKNHIHSPQTPLRSQDSEFLRRPQPRHPVQQ